MSYIPYPAMQHTIVLDNTPRSIAYCMVQRRSMNLPGMAM